MALCFLPKVFDFQALQADRHGFPNQLLTSAHSRCCARSPARIKVDTIYQVSPLHPSHVIITKGPELIHLSAPPLELGLFPEPDPDAFCGAQVSENVQKAALGQGNDLPYTLCH